MNDNWSSYWEGYKAYEHIIQMEQKGLPPSSLHAVSELDENEQLHDYFKEVQNDQAELDARVITSVHLYYLTRDGASPIKLSNVLIDAQNKLEVNQWWKHLTKTGITSFWFDVVEDIKSEAFKKNAKRNEKRLVKDARRGKLIPQGVFFTLLENQFGEGIVSVVSVVNDNTIIMTSKIVQGDINNWPDRIRTTANAIIHKAVKDYIGEDALKQEDTIFNILSNYTA